MRFLIYLLIVFIISCKSSNFKEKGKYIFENDFITREIHFINDTICEFKQVYKCEDLNKNFKEFKTIYRYFYNDTTIITSENKKLNLKLLHLKKPNLESYNFIGFKYIEIPIQNSKCYFLNDKSREELTENITYEKTLKIKRKMTIYESTNRIYDIDAFSLLIKSKNKLKFNNEVYILSLK
ncbi:hypothetical protein [Flavobacterium filum]|uniref:hypothetical protein n=1 Tax=Flavobacterium filum TaxID=370974 RepID=UPI00041F7F8D|nr:hypothetical protein [Flavobacterium filum]